MADPNNPEVSSESLQATPAATVNGAVNPDNLLPVADAPSLNGEIPSHPPASTSSSVVGSLMQSGLHLAIAIGIGILVGLVPMLFGYPALPSFAAGVVGVVAAGAVARGLLRRSPSAHEHAAAEESQAASDGFREVIETIVFVVVLVLLLKSFVAEAFVIPTGSMAETLYGYQRLITCPQCGLVFPVNASPEADPQPGADRSTIVSCECPSCRYKIDFNKEEQNAKDAKLAKDRGDPDWRKIGDPEWKAPSWSSGDRVLVAKFLYELFGQRPNRLDVVVFKFPGNSAGNDHFPLSGPMKNQTPMNYIKRLVGLPGETIAIHRGRLYVLPPEKALPNNDWKEAQTDEQKRITLWQLLHAKIEGETKDGEKIADKLFREQPFTLIRKPPETMLQMARLVYDNEHQAKDLTSLPPRWAGDGWKEDKAGFKHAGANGDGVQWLRYRNYLRDFNAQYDPKGDKPPVRSLISDFMGYNFYTQRNEQGSGLSRALPSENWVGDLMLESEVSVDKNQGEITMELSRSHDRFQLRWNLATGDLELWRIHGLDRDRQQEKLETKKVSPPKPGSKYLLRFANFDDRLTVWIDDTLPFGDGVAYEAWGKKHPGAPEHAGPTEENDLEPASIGVKGTGATVLSLKLWRDTYYTAGDNPSGPDANGDFDLSKPDTWGPLRDRMKLRAMYVQPEHFLCLGDNSPESSDGRSWGLVPERLLLGRAMLVYYPIGRVGRIR